MTRMRIGDRVFIRCDTKGLERGSFLLSEAGYGLVAMNGIVQVSGPASVRVVVPSGDTASPTAREWMAAKARRRRLPTVERYNPHNDPRLMKDYDDDDW